MQISKYITKTLKLVTDNLIIYLVTLFLIKTNDLNTNLEVCLLLVKNEEIFVVCSENDVGAC